MRSVSEYFFDRWYDRATRRAAEDPTWAKIESRRTLEALATQHDIMYTRTPLPKYLTFLGWVSRGRTDLVRFVRRGYKRSLHGAGDSDVWNLNSFLAATISHSTRRLVQEGHGYPCDMEPDEWQKTLMVIADGFDAAKWLIREWPPIDDSTREVLLARYEAGFEALRAHFFDLWD